MSNRTFTHIGGNHHNACVGDNGQPDRYTLARGYSKAAIILIDAVVKDEARDLNEDELIYPICYSMRHSVELRLKEANYLLECLAKVRRKKIITAKYNTHHLRDLWERFIGNSEILDSRFKGPVGFISPTILDFVEIDNDGEAFRYDKTLKGKKHLVDQSAINIGVLRQAFPAMEQILEIIQELCIYLIDEYELKTCTASLSRLNIRDIAKSLPPRSEWGSDKFHAKERELTIQYHISGREFSRALDLIENHYQFAPLIGIKLPMPGITMDHLFQIFDEHVVAHPKVRRRVSTASTITVKEIVSRNERLHDMRERLKHLITPEVIASLSALFYHNEYLLSERFQQYHSSLQREFKSKNLDFLEDRFISLFDKMSLIREVVITLFSLRLDDYAEQIINRYELSEEKWLKGVRNGSQFVMPAYSRY